MKKLFYLFTSFCAINSINAQFITTNPSTTPVTVGSDLNLAAAKVLKMNGATVFANPGTNNLFVGANTGPSNTGSGNLFFGDGAGFSNSAGGSNVFVGASSGFGNAGGSNNLFLGTNAGRGNIGGSGNMFFGNSAGYNNGNAANNMFIGASSGFTNTLGTNNVFIGNSTGRFQVSGNFNTFIGDQTGYNNNGGTNNTFIGANAGVSVANAALTNATAIGFNANVAASNSLVLGNGVANVGINTSAPSAKLHVVGTVRLENLPTDAVSTAPTTAYVVIDNAGNLYRYGGAAAARIGAPEGTTAGIPTSFTENWTLKNDYLFNKNKKGIIIGEGITALPKGYGMYVTDGILTEKVKVAIKNSSDWADYVFNKDYKKMSLTDVEKFIKVNKHLPNMLSASEMVTEGNDLAKTDAKLLEKIEELTLYMIEMKKENTQMKRQINSLKRKINK